MSVDSLHRSWWESFCRQHEKSEDEMKALLFNGELSKKEFRSLISCIFHVRPCALIFYPELFKRCPQLIDRCNWNLIECREWIFLLQERMLPFVQNSWNSEHLSSSQKQCLSRANHISLEPKETLEIICSKLFILQEEIEVSGKGEYFAQEGISHLQSAGPRKGPRTFFSKSYSQNIILLILHFFPEKLLGFIAFQKP